MAITAQYLRTNDWGREPDIKAKSVISVDGQEVIVDWWPGLLEQWPAPELRAYLEAEALEAAGYRADARAHLRAVAAAAPWTEKWCDEHPEPTPATPVSDPLAG